MRQSSVNPPSEQAVRTPAGSLPIGHSAPAQADSGPGADENARVDPSLIAAAARGDQLAWAELVGNYGRRVYAFARSRVRDPETAEEITQSVFATIADKLTRGGYTDDGRFEAWLFRLAGNRIRDEIRRRKRRGVAVSLDGAAPQALPETKVPADVDRLRVAVAALPEADREIISLRHHAGLSFAQIAEALDEPVGTLLARHHRALKKLRGVLGADQDHR